MRKYSVEKITGRLRVLSALSALFLLGGCIENDIPYPYLVGEITQFKVEGMVDENSGNPGNVQINKANRTISLEVNDQVDIQALRITSLKVTNDASIFPDSSKCNVTLFPEKGFPSLDSVPSSADTRVNFATPVKFMVKTYQDYLWTITVSQTFKRVVELSGQVGDAVFDTKNKQAIVYVAKTQSLKDIKVTKMQLGSSLAVTTPEPTEIRDFSRPVEFKVSAFGRDEVWKVSVLYTENTSGNVKAFSRTKQAIVNGEIQSGASVSVEYKEKSVGEWKAIPAENVTVNATRFTATLTGLQPSTDYQCRPVINGAIGSIVNFRTAPATPLTNASFDEWSQDPSKPLLWNPWAASGTSFWDTGNKGATILPNGKSNSYPTDTETSNGTGYAAKLESKFIVLKFAAGNIFAGSYVKTDGMDGVLNFGREFSSFPTKLKIHYKYTPATINRTDEKYGDFSHLVGKPDSCCIYLALTDWNAPLEIRTKYTNRQLFDKNDNSVIAYTELVSGDATTSYQEIELPITYRYTDRTPKYMVLVATSSKYGDYFTGGEGSTLLIDDFELIYE